MTLVEEAVALQPRRSSASPGMDEDERAELLRFGPERMEPRAASSSPLTLRAEQHAAHAQALERLVELLRGQVGMLQRDVASATNGPAAERRARPAFVLDVDHSCGHARSAPYQ